MLLKLIFLFVVLGIGFLNYYFAKAYWCDEGILSEKD